MAYGPLEDVANRALVPTTLADTRAAFDAESIATSTQLEAFFGPPSRPVIDRVDIVARRHDGHFAVEARATPGPTSNVPAAQLWKASPSVAPDEGEGYIMYSVPLASGWRLGGELPDATLTNSPIVLTILSAGFSTGNLAMLGQLPFGLPLYVRILTPHSFRDAAVSNLGRLGMVLPADGKTIDLGLVTKPADGPCILAAKPACTAAERLKVGAKAVSYAMPSGERPDHRFVRLVSVKGSTSLVVALSDSATALDALKLHATTADPLDASFRGLMLAGTQMLPWLAPSQRLQLGIRLDSGAILMTAAPAP